MQKQETDAAASDNIQFDLQRIYIKDLSFESPKPVESFRLVKESPEINLQFNTEVQKLGPDLYEIALKITVTAQPKNSKTFLYRVEIKQAGLFKISNYKEEEMAQLASIYCPNILFPYARGAISALVERGGFPQLLLAPINFEALFHESNRLKAAEKK
jgi:preprotein translocase subunit SecB